MNVLYDKNAWGSVSYAFLSALNCFASSKKRMETVEISFAAFF